jgi:hypothetical protein
LRATRYPWDHQIRKLSVLGVLSLRGVRWAYFTFVLLARRFSTPTALCNLAQGCALRATLGLPDPQDL